MIVTEPDSHNSHPDDKLPVVTTVYAKIDFVRCPHCDEEVDGWLADPRGRGPQDCDHCNGKFLVHPDADLELPR